MKMNGKWRSVFVMLSIAACSAVAFSCDDDDDNDNDNTPEPTPQASYIISGNASGAQMVPAVEGTGSGMISGTYNPNTRVLTYTNTWSGLTGAPTGGGFYTGASGVNGTATGTPWTFDSATTGTGTHTGTITLTEAQATQLTSGNWYYGYNTATNTNGEVRGQITASQTSNP